jgi:hypothetical protein
MAVNRLNKKGYFFSLTVMIALLLVSVYFAAFSNPGQTRESAVSSHRISEVNRFLVAIEEDAKTAIHVASLRTILVFEEYIQENSAYIDPAQFGAGNIEVLAQDLLLRGELGGESPDLIIGSNMGVWAENIMEFGYLGVNLEFSDVSAGLYQEDPWHVKAFYEFRLVAFDAFTNSTWDKPVRVEATHPIMRFLDPIYFVESRGTYYQNYRRHDIEPDFPLDLGFHVQEKYYINAVNAPSFLQRFTGMNGVSIYGLESLVNVPALSEVGYFREGSIVDRIYFSSSNPPSCNARQVTGIDSIPSWVVLDHANAPKYGVNCPVSD